MPQTYIRAGPSGRVSTRASLAVSCTRTTGPVTGSEGTSGDDQARMTRSLSAAREAPAAASRLDLDTAARGLVPRPRAYSIWPGHAAGSFLVDSCRSQKGGQGMTGYDDERGPGTVPRASSRATRRL